MTDVLAFCPPKVATGGTEAIHQLVRELNKYLHAVILYPGQDPDPQPPEYARYGCEFITDYPEGFNGVVIFPEIWANNVCHPMFKDAIKVVNWAGVDVYDWHTPEAYRGMYLQAEGVIHIAQSAYAVDHLRHKGVETILRLSDILNDDFFEPYEEKERNDVILYNPAKLTPFGRAVMVADFKFQPVKGLSREGVIELLRTHKLYLDFNVFSGRERLLREAVMCGCCALVSTSGCAQFFEDVAIPDEYKFDMKDWNLEPVHMAMREILDNYEEHKENFDIYRRSIRADQERYPDDVKAIAEEFKKRLWERSQT